MASITNRSKFFVTVTKRSDLYREFPFSALAKANAYLALLRQEGYRSARLGQHTNKIQVRVRHKGFPDQIITLGSLEAAEQLLLRIQSERASGLVIDYSSARRVTMAQLVERYLKEECPKHKGASIEGYTIRGMLADSRGELERTLKERVSNDSNGRRTSPIRARREPRQGLEWFHKPFADVVPTVVEEFIEHRLEQVSPATVDREVDLLAAVINLAIRTWRVRVPQSPLDGVRRPKYFNERDRRLRGDEEARLLAAAREEDLERSLAPVVEEALAPARLAAEQGRRQFAVAPWRFSGGPMCQIAPLGTTAHMRSSLREHGHAGVHGGVHDDVHGGVRVRTSTNHRIPPLGTAFVSHLPPNLGLSPKHTNALAPRHTASTVRAPIVGRTSVQQPARISRPSH